MQEKVVGKTHPDTLLTTMNMANAYCVGLKDFANAEEMYMLALDGYEKSLGRDHEDTKQCATNLAKFHVIDVPNKENFREIVKRYPFLQTDPMMGPHIRTFLNE